MNTLSSFWQLLCKHTIAIPLLQRDYAQGRLDDDARRVRAAFLNALHEALKPDAPRLSLDFVYGTTDADADADAPLSPITPLDGQQRLTTLWLLHWYLVARADGLTPEVTEKLTQFSYEHRVSAQAFCQMLAQTSVAGFIAANNQSAIQQSLADYLCNQTWFQEAWRRDATVSGMLEMLSAIAEKFEQTSVDAFARLTSADQCPIGFAYFSLKKYGLSDDLYVRMNARGRALTPFENWKAQFEQLLQDKHDDEATKYFAEAVDGHWTDSFWKNWPQEVRDTSKNPAALVDEPFKRFVDFVTKQLCHLYYPEKAEIAQANSYGLSFVVYEAVYGYGEKNREADEYFADINLRFLFSALELLPVFGEPDALTAQVFSRTKYERDRVALYWDEKRTSINLFEELLRATRRQTELDEVLLFSLLTYVVARGEQPLDLPVLRDAIRIVRNLWRVGLRDPKDYHTALWATRCFVESCALTADAYRSFVNSIGSPHWEAFKVQALHHEREKAKLLLEAANDRPELQAAVQQLEDVYVFKGNITQIQPVVNRDKLTGYAEAATAIWQASDATIARALLTIGDYSVWEWEGYKRNMGGRKDHEWHRVLTANKPRVEALLPIFFDRFLAIKAQQPAANPEAVLDTMAEQWLASPEARNNSKWRHFIAYKQMLEVPKWYDRMLLCSFTGDDGNPYVKWLSRSKRSSKAYCPYAKIVADHLRTSDLAWVSDNLAVSNESPLELKQVGGQTQYGEMYYSEGQGWRVVVEGHSLSDAVKNDFKWSLDGKWLQGTQNQSTDAVETAIAFVERLAQPGSIVASAPA